MQATSQPREAPLPGGDFRLFIEKMRIQALLTLGLVENPVTGQRETNLPHARALIQDLEMLRDKTAGNLTSEEHEHLEAVLADLQSYHERLASL